jgi:hypothetical protein
MLLRIPPLPAVWFAGALVLMPGSTSTSPERGPGNPSRLAVRADSGRKLAVIIAIARYPRASGYSRLSSDNDVPLLRAALRRQGFDSSAIRVLADSQATRAGILQALDDLAAGARPGDVVVVHYSGHGHQITDDNGDELDGLDEVLVPFDARGDVDPETYQGQFHVRDDELEPRLARIRDRVAPGGNVVMFIDACHSGSATRSALPVRGGLPPIGKPARTATRGVEEGAGWVRATVSATRSASGGGAGPAPMVVFSAARQDQLASEVELKAEDRTAGSLSVALSRALANLDAGGGRVTYRALFDQVKGWMQGEVPLQTPQLEGDADVELFSGRAVSQRPYLRVASVEGDSLAVLEGGSLVGLLAGTMVSFHAIGTSDPAGSQAIATGEVIGSDELAARVRVAPGGGAVARSWAFVTAYGFQEFRIRVRLDPAIPVVTRNALSSEFGQSGVVEVSDSIAELMVRPVGALARGGAPLTVSWAEDTTVALLGPVDATTAEGRARLTERVRTLARSGYLKRVTMQDPRIRVRVELVPATHRFAADGSCDARQSDTTRAAARLTAGSQWELRPNDGFFLRFVNHGSDPAYIAVLDLTPDGEIGQLFPRPDLAGEDNLLPPGATYRSTICFFATEPYGTEVIKLFATRKRVDFAPVLTARGPTRGTEHPLERLLAHTYGRTRAGSAAAPQGTGTTATLTLQIVPPAR